MNNMESQEIFIHIDWSGPHSLDAVSKFNGATDYGVYQVYGTHPVYGSGVLLYIGRTTEQTFGVRLSQEEKGWLANPDSGHVEVYVGRLWGSKTPAYETWRRHIVFAERLLINAHEPALNAQKELKALEQEPELQWVHVINWHQYRDLQPEVSGACWVGFDCQTFRHFGTPDHVASSTESQPAS